MQGVVDNEARTWQALWESKGSFQAPVFDNVTALPRLTPSEIRAAAAVFPEQTGIGGDHLHPRWFVHLSYVSLKHVAFFFFKLETLGLIPTTLWTELLMYNKLLGGFSPYRVAAVND